MPLTRGDLLAHGIGGQKDLPIPLSLTIAGGVAALVISFTVLSVAWRTPRYAEETTGLPVSTLRVRVAGLPRVRLLPLLTVPLLVLTTVSAALGDNGGLGGFFPLFMVIWVVLVGASLLLGHLWGHLSPFRALTGLLPRRTAGGTAPSRPVPWPAALLLAAFVVVLVVAPHVSSPGPVRVWWLAYVVLMLVAGTLRGPDVYRSVDPLEVCASLDDRVSWPLLLRAARVFGMVVFLFTAFCAVFGRDSTINPLFGIFYIWLWVGLVPLSLLFGPVWKAISPVRTINLLFAKLAGSDPDEGLLTYPAWLGKWPAALGLFAFVYLELVYPYMSEVASVRFWCAAYVAVMLVGGALYGTTFYENADPFEVYSTLVGKLSIWSMRDGRLVVLSPLANLGSVSAGVGLIGVTGVLFGSTGFDSFGESTHWVTFVQNSDLDGRLLKNVALIGFCLLAMGIFALGSVLTGVGAGQRRRELPSAFAHSLVPIVVGYVFAHYLTFLLEIGSRTLVQASDPLSRGWDILGTGDWGDLTWLSYHPTLLATIKVLAVVLGHVLAAIVAHDRALRLLPVRHQLTGQLPLLFAMVGFTGGGLYLLFAA
ncbi:hypothetical protein BH11ACT8_BH11ACT8_09370 [soil metagenome]